MNDVSKKGIGELVGSLTAGQLVAVVTVAAALVTSTFGFGFWLGQTLEVTEHQGTKRELSTARERVSTLEADLERVTADQAFLQTKNRFLGLLVLWHDARARLEAGDRTAELERRFDELSRNLFEFVMEVVDQSRSGTAEPAIRARLGKGIEPTITFERDGSTFPLPQRLFATAE